MLRMRQPAYEAIIIFIFILHFGTLRLESSPLNSRRNRKHGNTDGPSVETTTLSLEEVMRELFVYNSVPTKPTTPFTTSVTKPPTTVPTVRTRTESKVNVSDVFYYRLKVDDYPDLRKVEHLLKKYDHLFDNDKADPSELDSKTLMESDKEKYIHLCGNQEITIPLAAEVKNKKDEKVLLVNYDKYEQTIRGEICGKFNDTPCGDYLKNYHDGYQPFCKQNYISRKMVVIKRNPIDENDLDVVEDEIPIPGCCECVLKDLSLMSAEELARL